MLGQSFHVPALVGDLSSMRVPAVAGVFASILPRQSIVIIVIIIVLFVIVSVILWIIIIIINVIIVILSILEVGPHSGLDGG